MLHPIVGRSETILLFRNESNYIGNGDTVIPSDVITIASITTSEVMYVKERAIRIRYFIVGFVLSVDRLVDRWAITKRR